MRTGAHPAMFAVIVLIASQVAAQTMGGEPSKSEPPPQINGSSQFSPPAIWCRTTNRM
jgi:hypothetical protein